MLESLAKNPIDLPQNCLILMEPQLTVVTTGTVSGIGTIGENVRVKFASTDTSFYDWRA